MLLIKLSCIAVAVSVTIALQFPANPTSEMSADDKFIPNSNKTDEQSDQVNESGQEIDTDNDDAKDKKFLTDALNIVLDPTTTVVKSDDVVDALKLRLNNLHQGNETLEIFMDEMDNLSLEACKMSQEALWSYVTDINNEIKKNEMVRIAAEEDVIKKQYWDILKEKYLSEELLNDTNFQRKIRIVKERGTNVQMPNTKQREEIDLMQQIWSRVAMCAYNVTDCNTEDSVRTMSDIILTFRTSNNTNELAYYWQAYRDATGKKIRPIFKDYILKVNQIATAENFTDAGDLWRYIFEDDNFLETTKILWHEIKPIYDVLHSYVKSKLRKYYKTDLKNNDNIPAHLLGNIWAQEWQAIYPKVAPYPEHVRPKILDNTLHSKDLFDAVNDFHQSLGFESAKESYSDIKDTTINANCLPSSHDMCDGVNYKIKWCGEKVNNIVVGLSRAARLLGHIQYFKHYRNLPPLYRDGPNPAFHDAISDIVALQMTSPEYLNTLNFVNSDTGDEVTMNHLLWVALEKLPLMGYAYVLDKWRWDVFANTSLVNWNQHWWDLRIKETGVSPPTTRNESDLDPAAKYHVVSHVQYITYLISPILEFQILLSMCKKVNHTGPLHECSIHGDKEAGKLLSDGMSLGASRDWRTVLETITGETELKTTGIKEYFSSLVEFLKKENVKMSRIREDVDETAPITIGIVAVILIVLIICLYYIKKYNVCSKLLSVCGLRENGSLDIATRESTQNKSTNVIEGISEDKL